MSVLLDADARFLRLDILRPMPLRPDQPVLMAPIRIASDALSLFTIGRRSRAVLGAEFPAQRIESGLEWDDLVLHPGTLKQLAEIKTFITHGDTLMRSWGMSARLRPGIALYSTGLPAPARP